MGLPEEGAEPLASVLTGLKDPRLASDPLVRQALEAGADLVQEALDHAPTSTETHPFLTYLSRGSLVRAIRKTGSRSIQDHHLRYRWHPHTGYLHDLVAYMRFQRRSRSFADRNADWITEVINSPGRPAEAIRRVTNANQQQVLENPLFRVHLLVAAILGSATAATTTPDVYAEVDDAWLPIIDAVIKRHRRQLRPDVSLRDIVEILVAVGEGIALRELASSGDSSRRERRVTLQGTTALALMYACTVPDDELTAFGLDSLFDD